MARCGKMWVLGVVGVMLWGCAPAPGPRPAGMEGAGERGAAAAAAAPGVVSSSGAAAAHLAAAVVVSPSWTGAAGAAAGAAPAFGVAPLGAAARARLVAEIEKVLRRAPVSRAALSVVIFEVAAGSAAPLLATESAALRKPASNLKLVTTAAALGLLGEDYRLETVAQATGTIDAEGRLDGDLVLRFGHDFSYAKPFYRHASSPLNALAADLHAAGLRRVGGKVVVSGELVYGGTATGEFKPGKHRQAGAKALRAALQAAGIRVGQVVVRDDFPAIEEGRVLARHQSPPLAVLIQPINQASHNEMADLLLRHLGWRHRGESSYAAGAEAVLAWLAAQGMDTAGMVMADGSGLSHDNRVSAAQLAALLTVMWRGPLRAPWVESLAVGGESGTYAGRLRGADTKGHCHLKSGTLRDVIASSGFVVNAHSGRVYGVALVLNEMRQKQAGRAALDAVVRVLAGEGG